MIGALDSTKPVAKNVFARPQRICKAGKNEPANIDPALDRRLILERKYATCLENQTRTERLPNRKADRKPDRKPARSKFERRLSRCHTSP
jgi:hypothetical protein